MVRVNKFAFGMSFCIRLKNGNPVLVSTAESFKADIRPFRLKFGEERVVLRQMMDIVHELLGLISGTDFSWESIRQI
jgi:hypothetical protein